MDYDWPLMNDCLPITARQRAANVLMGDARLTQGPLVARFEKEFARWQGAKHAVFVSSGSMANVITLEALAVKQCTDAGRPHRARVLVPVCTWPSDILAVHRAGFEPTFVDIDLETLGMRSDALGKFNVHEIAAVFLTHAFGYSALSQELMNDCMIRHVPIVEDCCESIGAITRWGGHKHKVGCFGLAANFSFYWAHHMSCLEAGMATTDDDEFAANLRMLRGHGLVRECGNDQKKAEYAHCHADCDPQFLFSLAGYNCRNTEVGAALGLAQLPDLDARIAERRRLAKLFFESLDRDRWHTCDWEYGSPYGLPIVPRARNPSLPVRIAALLHDRGIEFRKGVVGGGNQARQPYFRARWNAKPGDFPNAEHLHFQGFAVGLWPGLAEEKVVGLAKALNAL